MPSNFHRPMLKHARHAGDFFARLWGDPDRLTQVHFFYTLLAAFLLHISAYGIWLALPRTPVIEIPVRVLSIKLGDADEASDQDNPQPARDNASSVENIISKVAHDAQDAASEHADAAAKLVEKAVVAVDKKSPPPKKDKAPKVLKSKPFDMRTEGVAVAAPVTAVVEKQYVRETAPASPLGSSSGNNAEIMQRYEQLISAWIDKFKPDHLSVTGQPAKVTASVRIRIDRRGNIRFMELEHSTQFVVLDNAALDTVRRANPVPAAPADYPLEGESIEFIVPVVFTK